MHPRLTRRSLLSLTALTGAVGLVGCGKSPAPPVTSGSVASPNSTPVQYWTFFQDKKNEDYFREHFVKAYSGPAPVEITVKSTDTIDRLIQTALAAGKGPDVVLTPGPSYVPAYDKAGYLAELDAYAKKFGWDTKFAGWSLQASQIDGKLISLPASYESMAFYFSPEVLDKEGLKPPTNRGEFENFCDTALGKGKIPLAAGNADWKAANEWHITVFLDHYAGPKAVYSALQGETAWTDPIFVEAISLLKGYFQKGYFGGSVSSYFTNTFPTVYKQLATGQAFGMISGTWEMANLPTYFADGGSGSGTNWDWTTCPSFHTDVPTDVWDLGIGASIALNAKSPNLGGAADYLNFLTTDTKTITAAIEAVSMQPPPVKLSTADFTAKADERIRRLYTELPKAQNIGYTTWTFYPQQTETYMIQEFEKVITNKTSVQDYCAGINDQFKKEKAAGKVPVAPKPAGLGG